jgi:predicted ferric reductase
MATTFKAGDAVTVEGPYGRFDFDDGNQRQIWVGGGIGITPFIARMKELQRRPPERRLDFYHATSDVSEDALSKLRADASAAGVQVHIIAGKQVPRLTADRIKRELPDWKEASIWFCGPPSFGQALRRDFIRAGGRSSRFHQEMFEMR